MWMTHVLVPYIWKAHLIICLKNQSITEPVNKYCDKSKKCDSWEKYQFGYLDEIFAYLEFWFF